MNELHTHTEVAPSGNTHPPPVLHHHNHYKHCHGHNLPHGHIWKYDYKQLWDTLLFLLICGCLTWVSWSRGQGNIWFPGVIPEQGKKVNETQKKKNIGVYFHIWFHVTSFEMHNFYCNEMLANNHWALFVLDTFPNTLIITMWKDGF